MAYFEHNYTPVLQTMVTVFLLLGESLTSALKHHSAHKYPHVKGLLHSPRLLKKKTLIRQTVENNNGRQLEKIFCSLDCSLRASSPVWASEASLRLPK